MYLVSRPPSNGMGFGCPARLLGTEVPCLQGGSGRAWQGLLSPSTAGSFWPHPRSGESHPCPFCPPIPIPALPQETKDPSRAAHRQAGPGQGPRLRYLDQKQPAIPKGHTALAGSSRVWGLSQNLERGGHPQEVWAGSFKQGGGGWAVARSPYFPLGWSEQGESQPPPRHLSLSAASRVHSPWGWGREARS